MPQISNKTPEWKEVYKSFLYHSYSNNKEEADNLYKYLVKEKKPELEEILEKKEFSAEDLYYIFATTRINKNMINKLKKKLYSMTSENIFTLIKNNDYETLTEMGISYNEEDGKFEVPAEWLLLANINDLCGNNEKFGPNMKTLREYRYGEIIKKKRKGLLTAHLTGLYRYTRKYMKNMKDTLSLEKRISTPSIKTMKEYVSDAIMEIETKHAGLIDYLKTYISDLLHAEKTRGWALTGLGAFMGSVSIALALSPWFGGPSIILNPDSYLGKAIPTIFYSLAITGMTFSTVTSWIQEKLLINEFRELERVRHKIVDGLIPLYLVDKPVEPEEPELEDMLKSISHQKGLLLEAMIHDRAGKEGKKLSGVLGRNYFLGTISSVKSSLNLLITTAVALDSPINNLPILGPLTFYSTVTSNIAGLLYTSSNTLMYKKWKETFKEKIKNLPPEESIWKLIYFLKQIRHRSIIGNYMSIGSILTDGILTYTTILSTYADWSNPLETLTKMIMEGNLGLFMAGIGVVGGIAQTMYLMKPVKKEMKRLKEITNVKERIKIKF